MTDDERFMQHALALAAHGAGQTAPNPMVGAVVARDGVIVGEGWHARFGDAHAEVVALQNAGDAAHGATVYVTLEPCNHTGKTPPCVDAMLAAGVHRVVFATADPTPIAGGGAERLRAHGVIVQDDVLRDAAMELNAPFFFTAQHTHRPFVTLKLALSIDGAIADATRARRWLTGDDSRRAVHAMRRDADGVAIGIHTALADDPLLTVREIEPPRVAPTRIVFDRRGRLPSGSALVRTAAQTPLVVVMSPAGAREGARLEQSGARLVVADTLADALKQLRTLGIRHLLVEGGAELGSAFLDAGFVDRLVIFQAPVVLGAGALSAFATLSRGGADRTRLVLIGRQAWGVDVMSTYAVNGD